MALDLIVESFDHYIQIVEMPSFSIFSFDKLVNILTYVKDYQLMHNLLHYSRIKN